MPTSSTLRPWVCLHKHAAASDPRGHSGLRVELVGVSKWPWWPKSGAGGCDYGQRVERPENGAG